MTNRNGVGEPLGEDRHQRLAAGARGVGAVDQIGDGVSAVR